MSWWENDEQLWDIYESATHNPTENELEVMYGISEDDLKDLFEMAFIADNVSHEEREEAREMFFDWMEDFGYDASDFDWDAWRDWYDAA